MKEMDKKNIGSLWTKMMLEDEIRPETRKDAKRGTYYGRAVIYSIKGQRIYDFKCGIERITRLDALSDAKKLTKNLLKEAQRGIK